MKPNRNDNIIEIQTGNGEHSDIDLFSKLESTFLEKFFKYNLTDYFPALFTNLYEDHFDRKVNIKQEKNLISSLLISKAPIKVSEL
jgi:hypothetical protein